MSKTGQSDQHFDVNTSIPIGEFVLEIRCFRTVLVFLSFYVEASQWKQTEARCGEGWRDIMH